MVENMGWMDDNWNKWMQEEDMFEVWYVLKIEINSGEKKSLKIRHGGHWAIVCV